MANREHCLPQPTRAGHNTPSPFIHPLSKYPLSAHTVPSLCLLGAHRLLGDAWKCPRSGLAPPWPPGVAVDSHCPSLRISPTFIRCPSCFVPEAMRERTGVGQCFLEGLGGLPEGAGFGWGWEKQEGCG